MPKRTTDGNIKSAPSCLYDISWTLHRVTWPNNLDVLQHLLSSQSSRDRRARQMKEYLRVEHDNDSSADGEAIGRAGSLRGCEWDAIEAQSTVVLDERSESTMAPMCGIQITLSFERATCSVIILRSANRRNQDQDQDQEDSASFLPLCLSKAPAPLRRRIFRFLTETYHLTLAPLHIPPSLLQRSLETYLTTFTNIRQQRSSLPLPNSLVKTIIKDVKISLSFSAAISPLLRSMDIDIPSETVVALLQASRNGARSFSDLLAKHLLSHTGLLLPTGPEMDEEDTFMRTTRVVCGAFVLGAEGRLKLIGKAVDVAEADELGDLVETANEVLVAALIGKASKVVVDLT